MQWVEAMMDYYEVNSSIEPIRIRLRKAKAQLEAATKDLAETEETLKKLSEELEKLGKEKAEKDEDLQRLTEEKEILERRLRAAQKLIEGLGEEKERWGLESEQLIIDKEKLFGDCLLASAFLSYSGPFNFDFRQEMVFNNWKNDLKEKEIPHKEDFKLPTLLTDDVETSR